MSWPDLADWWVHEVEGDPAYESVVTPLLLDVLVPEPGRLYLDLGSGDGRMMKAVAQAGANAHGIELSPDLAQRSSRRGPTVVGRLPDLSFIRPVSYDGAYCVLAIEHIEDHAALFRSVHRVVAADGVLAAVMNHPIWTAPDSTPITDSDGEILWRPGQYFSHGSTDVPAGSRTVTFYHRGMGPLLNAAADAGWSLEYLSEAPHHDLADQSGIPRLLACRWRLLP
jgi:SAM-dependent methyltransferase